ncbi:hypothetical protein [Maioricimonas sp. JC845]|uniref:hypothetical protein n=1 Tax=Maioricimonas sp. JC845 TaxID=3232138 RepID=UPI00345ABA7A
MLTVTAVYDDRVPIPPDVTEIIGVDHFSDVLRRRVHLGDMLRETVERAGVHDFIHLRDDNAARKLHALISSNNVGGHAFVRLPSCFMPSRPDMLCEVLRKCRFARETTLLCAVADSDAPAVLTAEDMLGLLEARYPDEIGDFVLTLSRSAPMMKDYCHFLDLRDRRVFLEFMTLATEARHFNALEAGEGLFTKRSRDRLKMEREYRFFHVVPETMKRFLVPTCAYYDTGDEAGYSVERLAVPDVAIQWVHGVFDPQSFERFLNCFFEFIDARAERQVGREQARRRAHEVAVAKLDSRVEQFLTMPQADRVDAILTSCGPHGGIRNMHERVRSLVIDAIATDDSSTEVVGHGDPCFSNILFDRRLGLFRLIDPRGARNIDEAWTHPLYDLAKLSHSVLGGYDFVNNGLFDCVIDAELCARVVLQREPETWSRQQFLERLNERNVNPAVVRAYEASLFLSMLPFHVDSLQKLLGLSLVCCTIIDDLESLK